MLIYSYFLRALKLHLSEINKALPLDTRTLYSMFSCIVFRDSSFSKSFHPQPQKNADLQLLHSFVSLTKHPFCSPMKPNPPIHELPKETQFLCSWLPKGEHVFLYIVNGKGVLVPSCGSIHR